jgi:hypothetical protein
MSPSSACRVVGAWVGLAVFGASSLAALEPGDVIRDVWHRIQQVAGGDAQEPARSRPQAIQGGTDAPTISLRDLSHPISLEQRLERAGAAGELRLNITDGQGRLGDFSVGSDQSLKGDLLVVQGDANIFGRLEGNLVTWHGDVIVHPGAVVTGDVLALDGQVRLDGGDVAGEVRTLSAGISQGAALPEPSILARIARSLAGVTGAFLMLLLVGVGLVLFGRAPLEVVSDTVASSFTRSFVSGLLGQILVLPTFGMLIVGLILSVAGILLIPFVVIVIALLLVAAIVGGALAVAHAMGESLTRRQMAQGVALSPNSYRYVGLGLGGVFLIWLVWALFGWVPVAGDLMQGAAILVSWLLATVGFGAALLSRGGLKEQFAGRIIPAEMLTDEYLWATPRFGVPAAMRPDSSTTPSSGTPRLPPDDR